MPYTPTVILWVIKHQPTPLKVFKIHKIVKNDRNNELIVYKKMRTTLVCSEMSRCLHMAKTLKMT